VSPWHRWLYRLSGDFWGFEGAVRALKIHNIWHTVAGLFGGALGGAWHCACCMVKMRNICTFYDFSSAKSWQMQLDLCRSVACHPAQTFLYLYLYLLYVGACGLERGLCALLIGMHIVFDYWRTSRWSPFKGNNKRAQWSKGSLTKAARQQKCRCKCRTTEIVDFGFDFPFTRSYLIVIWFQ